ncbi:hypothetical protein HWV62_10853 [Athelia sp. TMB]|nr:hypothetical protein HWV62_10853 [Athelia sp. TMB]
MLLLPALQLLVSASTIVARAVRIDASTIPDANTTSFITSAPTITTLPDSRCKDIDHCRTLVGIVQSCIVTILACVWFAVHRNIPAPRVDPPHYSNLFVKVFMSVWFKILGQRQAVTVFVVTLLIPEWVLAWALRQFFVALELSSRLEEAREAAGRRQETELLEGREPENEVRESTDDGEDDKTLAESSGVSTHSENDRLIKRQVTSQDNVNSSKCKRWCEECGLHPSTDDIHKAVYDQVAVAQFVGKSNEAWKIEHAFFVIMGGYHLYNKNGPCHPLSPADVVDLVRRGHLVAPSSDELANQSKGDALSKGVAIVQTMWFVMQCIARRIENLPVTSLEVMTLAYAVITVAMYIVWWHKPLNISCAQVWRASTITIIAVPPALAAILAVLFLMGDTLSDKLRTIGVVSFYVPLALIYITAPPKVDSPKYDNPFVKIYMYIWAEILDQRQAAAVFLVALLVPEWVLAWALRQLFVARQLSKELEEAREEAGQRRETNLSGRQEAEKETSESVDDQVDSKPLAASTGTSTHTEHDQLLKRQVTPQDKFQSSQCIRRCEECGLHSASAPTDDVREAVYDQVAAAQFVAKSNEVWTIAHAFFVIMGGYYFYNKSGPRHPLSPKAVVELVRRGHLVAPTTEELANQSKGDALSKGVAVLQTLWFVMQCIARRIEHLPVTNLEVMTLAYTVMTVAMYVVWWDKPLNITCAVRVPEEEVEEKDADKYSSIWQQIGMSIMGIQDDYVDLRQCSRVPTFWAGRANEEVIPADIIALLVAMVFGAVHCIAWYDESQSPLEQQLWRASAIAIITTPAAFVLVLLLAFLLEKFSDEFAVIAIGFLWVLMALIYAAARLVLIVISFTSLSMLPVAAYQSVQWTTFVPHI